MLSVRSKSSRFLGEKVSCCECESGKQRQEWMNYVVPSLSAQRQSAVASVCVAIDQQTARWAPRLDMPKVTQFRDSDWCLNGILILPFASTEDVARIFPSTLPDLQVLYRDCGSAEKPRWHAVNVNNWREAVEFRFCMIYCSLFVGKKTFLRNRVGLFSIFKQNSVQPWSSRHKPLRRKWWRKQPVQRRLASLYSVSMRM